MARLESDPSEKGTPPKLWVSPSLAKGVMGFVGDVIDRHPAWDRHTQALGNVLPQANLHLGFC